MTVLDANGAEIHALDRRLLGGNHSLGLHGDQSKGIHGRLCASVCVGVRRDSCGLVGGEMS